MQRQQQLATMKRRHAVRKRRSYTRIVALRATTQCRAPSSTTPAKLGMRLNLWVRFALTAQEENRRARVRESTGRQRPEGRWR